MIAWDPWRHLHEWYPDVRVVVMKLTDGLQGCIDVEKRKIWLSTHLDDAQRRSVLAYELGFLELEPVGLDEDVARISEWAARLLIPFDGLLRGCLQRDELADVAEDLRVDVPTLRTRLRGLSDEEQALVGVDRWHIA